jgi:hypothetical protein
MPANLAPRFRGPRRARDLGARRQHRARAAGRGLSMRAAADAPPLASRSPRARGRPASWVEPSNSLRLRAQAGVPARAGMGCGTGVRLRSALRRGARLRVGASHIGRTLDWRGPGVRFHEAAGGSPESVGRLLDEWDASRMRSRDGAVLARVGNLASASPRPPRRRCRVRLLDRTADGFVETRVAARAAELSRPTSSHRASGGGPLNRRLEAQLSTRGINGGLHGANVTDGPARLAQARVKTLAAEMRDRQASERPGSRDCRSAARHGRDELVGAALLRCLLVAGRESRFPARCMSWR